MRSNSSTASQEPTVDQTVQRALTHHQAGELAEAEQLYRQVLSADPKHADALHLLGVIAQQVGHPEQAVELIQKALRHNPQQAEAHSNLGNALYDLGRLKEAARAFRRAIILQPEFANAHSNLGNALLGLNRPGEAMACCQTALKLDPAFADAENTLGNAHKALGELDKAAHHYQRAMELAPQHPLASFNLGGVLLDQGHLEGALSCYRDRLAIQFDFRMARSYLNALLFQPQLDHETLFTEQTRLISQAIALQPPCPAPSKPVKPLPDSTNTPRLRIGYLSSDLYDHPVGRNVLPLLAHHDHSRFEIFCYAEHPRSDRFNDALRQSADHWRETAGYSDGEVANQIRQDNVQIMVYLGGCFNDNRILVANYRPAPVQISFHGGASTGLENMDYWLSDSAIHPPSDTREQFTETLHRLPVFYNYPAPRDAPPISPLPAERNGMITFGSLNNPAKINDEVIALWSEILHQVSDAKMLLKFRNIYDNPSVRQRMLDAFAAHDIPEQRLMFHSALEQQNQHLTRYHVIDIALDPFPFTGATTTFQALWMGVPVVTLLGDRFISRMAGDILIHGGFESWAVSSKETYRERAVALASDWKRLAALRTQIRQQLADSPICQGAPYAASVETTFEALWKQRN
ncbi:MAG: tetratricopeptide repeat protein [Magnetococcales bacterium]|nr:tetratricopeptide repeat protein [Magnetococcales bacterium]